jgi:hypothetical protein
VKGWWGFRGWREWREENSCRGILNKIYASKVFEFGHPEATANQNQKQKSPGERGSFCFRVDVLEVRLFTGHVAEVRTKLIDFGFFAFDGSIELMND